MGRVSGNIAYYRTKVKKDFVPSRPLPQGGRGRGPNAVGVGEGTRGSTFTAVFASPHLPVADAMGPVFSRPAGMGEAGRQAG